MDHRSWLVASAVLASLPAHAFFATAATPAGWVAAAGGGAATILSSAAAWIGAADAVATARVSSAVNLATKATVLPAALKVSPEAAAVAGRLAFANPGIMALAIGTALYVYLNNENVFLEQGKWMKRGMSGSCRPYWTMGDGICYIWAANYNSQDYLGSTGQQACKNLPGGLYNHVILGSHNVCQATYQGQLYEIPVQRFTETPSGTTSGTVPATEQELITELEKKPLTAAAILAWPQEVPFRVPVKDPVLNPTADPEPKPQPLRVPQAKPVEVKPATDPKTYTTPVVDIEPANNHAEPWRVDIVTRTVTGTSPDTTPDPEPSPTDPTDPAPTETPPGLCDQYPDILACAKPKLGDLKESKIQDQKVDLSIKKDEGWGPANGTCPAPKTVYVLGVSLSMPFTMLCDFATAIRPLLIAFAYLTAALSFFGFARRD